MSEPSADSSTISPFTNNPQQTTQLLDLWAAIFPSWPISPSRFQHILAQPGSHHVLHESGFCLAYVDGEKGHLSVVGVLEGQRRKGLGTKLAKRVMEGAKATKWEVDSSFPRFWPGVLQGFIPATKDFFEKLGFQISSDPTPRDLYRTLNTPLPPAPKIPFTYAPWTPEGYEECMTKQRQNFSSNQPWVHAYELFHENKLHHEVMVAFDSAGAQVGWTMMCGPDSPMTANFAFVEKAGPNTGLIACVGIDGSVRGKGVGKGMMVAALEDMKRRGVEGVFIDWVVIRGFYETLGFDILWEYEKLVQAPAA